MSGNLAQQLGGLAPVRPVTPLVGVAAAVPGVVSGLLTVAVVLAVQPAQHFAQPVSGALAFGGGSKWGDLVAVPMAVVVGVFVCVAVRSAINCQPSLPGRRAMVVRFLWWSCPGGIALGSLAVGAQLPLALAAVTVGASLLMSFELLLSRRHGHVATPDSVSASALGCLLWAIAPIAVGVAIARTPVGLTELSDWVPWMAVAVAAGCVAAAAEVWGAIGGSARLESEHRLFVALPQCVFPLLVLAFVPARLLDADGTVTEYVTALALPVLCWIVAVGGVVLALAGLRRRREIQGASVDGPRLVTPFVALPLLLVGMFGTTRTPVISSDDYHYGEKLLGWFRYRAGELPYVDHQPAHGLVPDDLAALLASVFFDGSAAAHTEALRLTAALMATLLFTIVLWATTSRPLAVLVTVIIGTASLLWVFLAAAGWLLVAPRLRAKPRQWLVVWVLLTPVLILAVPAQGLALAGAAGALAVKCVGEVVHREGARGLAVPAAATAAMSVLALTTPIGEMLAAAVEYVVSNASVNGVAYGIPWSPGLVAPGNTPVLLEVLRMLWVAGLVLCCTSALTELRARRWRSHVLTKAVFFALFLGGMLPYMMGRVDPASPSRLGHGTMFVLALVIPAIVWRGLRPQGRAVLALGLLTTAAALSGTIFHAERVTDAADPLLPVGTLVEGSALGLPGWGRAAAEDPRHLDQTRRLAQILDATLEPGASYYDATSRNAQYFYVGRRPPVSVAAVYNSPLPADQRRTIRQLKQAEPKLAILHQPLGNITHDGGGLALRTPLLARYLEKAYTPYQQDGFILGYRGEDLPVTADDTVTLRLDDVIDADWDRGVSRTSAAIRLDDPVTAVMIREGASLSVPDGSRVRVAASGVEGGILQLSRRPPAAAFDGGDRAITVDIDDLDPLLYRPWLFERAFGQTDLGHLPASWGHSLDRMEGVARLADLDVQGRLDSASPALGVPLPADLAAVSKTDMVAFDVQCEGSGSPVLSLTWQSRDVASPVALGRRTFVADPGTQLVPLDSSAFWRSMRPGESLSIGLLDGADCDSVEVSDVSLWQRSD